MSNQPDVIEFYIADKIMGRVDSSLAPPVSSFISIAKETYKVTGVSYSLDYSDKVFSRQMRANVQLVKVKQ